MSDKTYAETRGEPPFDWWKALDNPTAFADNELAVKAGAWVTCACGNQCAIIPRFQDGQPKDDELDSLGMRFYAAVESGNWSLAKITLRQIESRSSFLISEELQILRSQPVTPAEA